MTYDLIAVSRPEHWRPFHDIRRQELFEAKGRFGIYDDNHPDDVAAFAHPFLLVFEGRPIGTTRLDLHGDVAIFRLVAITAAEQGRGHGRVLGAMVEEKARELGATTLYVNAAADAVGYYEKTGWSRYEWDRAELVGLSVACVQMRKLSRHYRSLPGQERCDDELG